MSRLRDQLILIQKRNYRKNLAFIRDTLDFNPKIARYESEYLRGLKDFTEISSKEEMYSRVRSSDVVFHGDYHTLKHSQRSVLRVLRDTLPHRKITLCLEMFHAEDKEHLDRFMNRKLTEKKFLKLVEYHRKWPFPWKNFRPIIQFCRENKIPVKGINCEPDQKKNSLLMRDQASARIIVKESIRHPDRLIYVVDGDYHVSPGHLPACVEKLARSLDIFMTRTILYQNSEYLYWKLCRMGKEESPVLKINNESYCLMNTMPANKIQSYLNWLEFSEDAWFPSSENGSDEFAGGGGITVVNIIENLETLLGLNLPKNWIERQEVYYGGDLDFMDTLAGIQELKGYMSSVKNKIKNEEAFLLTYSNQSGPHYLIYLPNSNINMAAEEAAHFVNVAIRGIEDAKLPAFDTFYKKTVTECLGFFGSKLINEKRKSQNPNSLKKFIRKNALKVEGKKADKTVRLAKLLVDHIRLQKKQEKSGSFDKKFKKEFSGRLSENFSTQLGYYMGNKLYYAVKKNRISLSRVKEYFSHPMNNEGESFGIYMDIVKRVNS